MPRLGVRGGTPAALITPNIMNVKIDPKSALFGLAAGVLAMLALGAAPAPAPNQTGRYRLEGSTPYFMLVDTITGQVWTGNFQNGLKPTDTDFFSPKGEK